VRKLILALVVLLGSGCVHRLSTDMNAWVGRPADDLVSEWGVPRRTADLSDGHRVMTWVRSWNSADQGREPVMQDCERSFTVAGGKVQSWSASGCPSVYVRGVSAR
jgi:hypothetical protein